MAVLLMYLKQHNCIYCAYLWLATLSTVNTQEVLQPTPADVSILNEDTGGLTTNLQTKPIEVAALGRPLFPGMLYDSRGDSFIPGVTLWDKKSLSEDLDSRPQLQTDLKFSSSDSFSSKSNLLDVSASLKASFLGGLVEVGGSAKFLRDIKSSNQQSRVTMRYSETTRFEQLTMTQLGKITYPQVFDQKTATHVITAVLYGAQAYMVFDRSFSEEENKQEIEGELTVMVKKIPLFSIEGRGAVKMTDGEKKISEKISCTFYGDFHLDQNPTTYIEALDLYKKLPSLLKDNPQNAVPIKVWLYPLQLLDTKAAQLVRDISTSLVSSTENVIDELEGVERRSNDLSRNTLLNLFIDMKERLRTFQESFRVYKTVLQKALARVLPAIRGGGMEEKALADVLKIHHESPFNAARLNQWLDDTKSELHILSSSTKMLEGINTVDSNTFVTTLLNPDNDVVACLTFTSLNDDTYPHTMKEFLKSDKFKELDEKAMVSLPPIQRWFNDPAVVIKMRENLSNFMGFSEANKNDKRMQFIIYAVSDPSSPGSSIYLYQKGKITNTQFQTESKPPPPVVKDVQDQTVSLKLHKSSSGETVQYRVEYKQVKADSGTEEQWLVINTADEDFILSGLESGKPYTIRYRIVGKVGVSEASDTVNPIPSSAQPVIVGGTVGNEFTFISPSISTIKKISIYYASFPPLTPYSWLMGVQVNFNSGHVIKTDKLIENDPINVKKTEFVFDDDDTIVALTLWPSHSSKQLYGLEFQVAKSNGTTATFSLKCNDLGKPVSVDVKSGKCYGISVRTGIRPLEIVSLGFYFI